MVLSYQNAKTVSVVVSDPTADLSLPIWRVPAQVTKIEILEAFICTDTTLAAGTQHGLMASLLDGGTAGTGTTAFTNVLGGTDAGGTFPAWTASIPQSWTISDGTLDAGDYVVYKHDESLLGTVAMLNVVIWFAYVDGVGA